MTNFCTKCGHKFGQSDNFCGKCGVARVADPPVQPIKFSQPVQSSVYTPSTSSRTNYARCKECGKSMGLSDDDQASFSYSMYCSESCKMDAHNQ
jgi:hypothetical protein